MISDMGGFNFPIFPPSLPPPKSESELQSTTQCAMRIHTYILPVSPPSPQGGKGEHGLEDQNENETGRDAPEENNYLPT